MKNFIILIFLLISVTCFSQKDITLSDAIQVALANNFQIQISKKQTQIAANNNTWGEAGRYPSINIALGQNNSLSDQSNNPTAFIKELVTSNSLQGGIGLNWNLFNGFAVQANKARLEQIKEQSKGNEVMVVENTIQAVVLAYNNALLQKDKLTLIKEVMSLSHDRLKFNELKEKLGSASRFDLLLVKNAFLSDSTNFLLQQIAYDNSLRNLKLLMQISEDIKITLSGKLSPNTGNYKVKDLETKMLFNNQNIKNQYINLEIMRQDIRLAKSQMYPTIGFSLGANVNNSQYRIGDFPSQSGLTIDYYGNFSLSFNLFNGGKVRRQLSNVKIQEQITNLNIDEAKLNLKSQLNTQYKLYETRKIIFNLVKETFDNSRINLSIAKEKYQTGVINSFDYRDIQMAYLNAGIATIDAAYNVNDSHTELLRLTGGLIMYQNN